MKKIGYFAIGVLSYLVQLVIMIVDRGDTIMQNYKTYKKFKDLDKEETGD